MRTFTDCRAEPKNNRPTIVVAIIRVANAFPRDRTLNDRRSPLNDSCSAVNEIGRCSHLQAFCWLWNPRWHGLLLTALNSCKDTMTRVKPALECDIGHPFYSNSSHEFAYKAFSVKPTSEQQHNRRTLGCVVFWKFPIAVFVTM